LKTLQKRKSQMKKVQNNLQQWDKVYSIMNEEIEKVMPQLYVKVRERILKETKVITKVRRAKSSRSGKNAFDFNGLKRSGKKGKIISESYVINFIELEREEK
jgi:hypothetical protein